MRIVAFTGDSNSGKTTLITRLCELLRDFNAPNANAPKFAVIKHDPKDKAKFESEEAKDSAKFFSAGANVALLGQSYSCLRINLDSIESKNYKFEKSQNTAPNGDKNSLNKEQNYNIAILKEIIFNFKDCDYIFIEGLKTLPFPRIAVMRESIEERFFPYIKAIALGDLSLQNAAIGDFSILDLNNPKEILKWINENIKDLSYEQNLANLDKNIESIESKNAPLNFTRSIETIESKSAKKSATIGILTLSDRASAGIYEDISGKAIKEVLSEYITSPISFEYRLIADDYASACSNLKEMASFCDLLVSTGGTGPAPRDITPEATQCVCEKMLPGFGEIMRSSSLRFVPTAILSRAVAGICGKCLIINLPGKPKAIRECLEAVFPAVPYCLDLIGAAYLECDENVIKIFRPKS